MKNLTKRAAALLGAAALSLNLAACGATANTAESAAESTEASSTAASSPAVESATAEQASAGVPKYIFLFDLCRGAQQYAELLRRDGRVFAAQPV